MNLIVSGTVLVIAAAAFFSFDLLSFRNDLIRNLNAEARIVGANSVSALLFSDPQSAADTLKGLQHVPDVLGAAIIASDGSVFAQYGNGIQADARSHSLVGPETNHAWPSGMHVLVAHRIGFNGRSIGVVYILARFTEIGQRARQYLLIAFVILLFCMVAALVISSFSRRFIAKPIIALADTARLVSREQDYSVRASVPADSSEIAILIDAFNTMLIQIQDRDAALNEARNELEIRVEKRTAELQAANRELEAFSYTVAHDLRNPLNAITNISFLLSQLCQKYGDPAVPAALANLDITTASMSSLIDDLLDFARVSTVALKAAPVNLSALAREIAANLAALNPDRKVRFSIDDVPEVSADPGLMRIVLDNLIGNSWKYTSHHPDACIEFGALTISQGDRGSGSLVYFVRDDGAGFEPERGDQLFLPFQRLHPKSEFPGTGIGLATVQRILARYGGTIWAKGAVEKGATFNFTLGAEPATHAAEVSALRSR
jgi:signal transduction histidine kinase